MTMVLDAGALIAAEGADRRITTLLKKELLAGRAARTHGGVVGQVWRGGHGRQAGLARLLAGVDVVPLDDQLGRRAGALLGRSGTADVIDAAIVMLADDGDEILTTDPDDLRALAVAAGCAIDIVPL